MISVIKRKKFAGNNSPAQICNDIQYFGEDVLRADVNDEIKELIKNSINKNCIVDGNEGVIIGFEDCCSFNDYYFIIYCPKTEGIVYELANNHDFIKTIDCNKDS